MKIGRSAVRAACGIMGAFLLLVAGCESPPDEAWLRIAGFQVADGTNTSSVEAPLGTATTTVTAVLENNATNVGVEAGVGISVTSVRIDYGGGLPSGQYPVTLYIPAPGKATPTSGVTAGQAKVEVPIAPASLKAWVKDNRAIPTGGLSVNALVRFSGRTDEGRDLDTTGGLLVTFTGP